MNTYNKEVFEIILNLPERTENGLAFVAPDMVAAEIWTGTRLVLNLESSPFPQIDSGSSDLYRRAERHSAQTAHVWLSYSTYFPVSMLK